MDKNACGVSSTSVQKKSATYSYNVKEQGKTDIKRINTYLKLETLYPPHILQTIYHISVI